jgi:hypothetical protein
MNRFFDAPGSSDNPPRAIVENGNRWYLCPPSKSWELPSRPHGFNAGDCLWWTSLAAITYPKNDKFMLGVRGLTPYSAEGKWRRHPFGHLEGTKDAVDDFTRDQLIMAIAALSTSGRENYKAARQAIRRTKFRISKSTFSRLDLWLWMKAVQSKSYVFAKLFTTLTFFKKLLAWPLYALTTWMYDYNAKQKHPNELVAEKVGTKFGRFLRKYFRPKAYPTHLCAWQLWTLKELGLGKSFLTGTVVRQIAGRYNYLITLLTGMYLSKEEIDNYESRHGWIWQTYIDESKPVPPKCSEEEKKWNPMDKDILYRLCK